MDEQDIQIYRHPNPEIRSYLTTDMIARPVFDTFEPPFKENPDRLSTRLGMIGAQVVREILSVPGIAQLRIKPKELRIKKEAAASWDDMEEAILRIVDRALRRSQMHVLKR